MAGSSQMVEKIIKTLPFELTGAQQRVLMEILGDLKEPHPMHRLVQGDVGCGKTIVAAFAICVSLDSGFQAALMVPTEVLAYQHWETLKSLFKDLSFCGEKPLMNTAERS